MVWPAPGVAVRLVMLVMPGGHLGTRGPARGPVCFLYPNVLPLSSFPNLVSLSNTDLSTVRPVLIHYQYTKAEFTKFSQKQGSVG